MESSSRARVEGERLIAIGTNVKVRNSQALDVDTGPVLEPLIPLLGRKVNLFWTYQCADPAALMAVVGPVPPFFLLRKHGRRLIDYDHASGQQIKQVLPTSRHRSIEFPSWEDCSAGCQHGMFHFDLASGQPSS